MRYFPDEVIVALQEIPGEISLIVPLAGCSHNCSNCHSPHYQDPESGIPLETDAFIELLTKYKDKVSCVCFFGGERIYYLPYLASLANYMDFKVALYSGFEMNELDSDLLDNLDYLKTGCYIERLGGLAERTTNQRMYEKVGGGWQDITSKFWR